MRVIVDRKELTIVPENPADEAFIEDTLNLNKTAEATIAVRVPAQGLDRKQTKSSFVLKVRAKEDGS